MAHSTEFEILKETQMPNGDYFAIMPADALLSWVQEYCPALFCRQCWEAHSKIVLAVVNGSLSMQLWSDYSLPKRLSAGFVLRGWQDFAAVAGSV